MKDRDEKLREIEIKEIERIPFPFQIMIVNSALKTKANRSRQITRNTIWGNNGENID